MRANSKCLIAIITTLLGASNIAEGRSLFYKSYGVQSSAFRGEIECNEDAMTDHKECRALLCVGDNPPSGLIIIKPDRGFYSIEFIAAGGWKTSEDYHFEECRKKHSSTELLANRYLCPWKGKADSVQLRVDKGPILSREIHGKKLVISAPLRSDDSTFQRIRDAENSLLVSDMRKGKELVVRFHDGNLPNNKLEIEIPLKHFGPMLKDFDLQVKKHSLQ